MGQEYIMILLCPRHPQASGALRKGTSIWYARLKYRPAVDSSATICCSRALHESGTGGRFADPPKELRDKVGRMTWEMVEFKFDM